MPTDRLTRFILLPELKYERICKENRFQSRIECSKKREVEYCPRCAQPSESTYDTRKVRIKDAPIRDKATYLVIQKRRLWCKVCEKPFTESVAGIRKGKRHTERYARAVLWACENFSDLKQVRKNYQCSAYFLYQTYYKKLQEKVHEQINYPWTKTIGIDEHSFRKNRAHGVYDICSPHISI